ncbi:hypothetical protein HPB47_012530, partial [Ixodes persulcatus]
NDRKFIVFETSLKELFRVCRKCHAPCESVSKVSGTLLKVQTLCVNSHCLLWKSQPILHGKPAGSVLMSAAILFTGASPTSVLRVPYLFEYKAVTIIRRGGTRTFFNYQRGYLLPAINRIWQQQQDELFSELVGHEVDLAGDGQYDSPGFCAKYMTYSLHAAQVNRILHFEQVQVGENKMQWVRQRSGEELISCITTDEVVQIWSPDENAYFALEATARNWRILIRGVKENIFGGLVRSPPTTVEGFITETTNIERALQARAAHYHRAPGIAAFLSSSCNTTDIREIIRDVVREEIKKLLPAAASPDSPSIAEIVREEVHQALQPEKPWARLPEPI